MTSQELFLGLYLKDPDDPHEMILLAVSLDRSKLEQMMQGVSFHCVILPIKLYVLYTIAGDVQEAEQFLERPLHNSQLMMELGMVEPSALKGKIFGYQRTTRSKTDATLTDVLQTLLYVSNDHPYDSDEYRAYAETIKANYDLSLVPIDLDTYYDEGVMNA